MAEFIQFQLLEKRQTSIILILFNFQKNSPVLAINSAVMIRIKSGSDKTLTKV